MKALLLIILLTSLNLFASEDEKKITCEEKIKCEVSSRCISITLDCNYLGTTKEPHSEHVFENFYIQKDTLSCVLNSGEIRQIEKLYLPERVVLYEYTRLVSKEEAINKCKKYNDRLRTINSECKKTNTLKKLEI